MDRAGPVGAHLPWQAYGMDDGKPANVNQSFLAATVDAFVEAFFTPDAIGELRAQQAVEPG